MKIEQLKQFIRVIECGSINKTADELYLAHSTLSTSLKNLEKELGYDLIIRNSRGVKLTKLGANVYDEAKMICQEVEFMQELSEKKEIHSETLRVANMYNDIANNNFIEIYKRHGKTENIEMKIQELSFLELIKSIETGLFEVGLLTIFSDTSTMQKKLMESKKIEYHKISDKQLFVVVGPKNPYFNSDIDKISLKALKDYPFVIYYGESENASWKKLLIDKERKHGNIFVNNIEVMMQFIEETDAFSIETYYNEKYRDSKYYRKARLIPIEGNNDICEFGWVKSSQKAISEIAEEYIALFY